MSDEVPSVPTELRIGLRDGTWSVATEDPHGWVEVGTGEPIPDGEVASWMPLAPANGATGNAAAVRLFDRVNALSAAAERLTAERDEARRQRDTLNPGEGRVVVELPDASEVGRDKSWARFGTVMAWLGTTEVQYRGELMGPGSAWLRAAEVLAAAELVSGTTEQGAAS